LVVTPAGGRRPLEITLRYDAYYRLLYGLPMHHVSNIVDLHSGNRDNNDDERSDRNAGEKRKRSDDKVFGAVSSSVYSYH
jgi:hypothetical protein